MLITVCGRLVLAWPGNGPDAGLAQHIDFAAACQAPATWDAHFGVYYLADHMHRLDSGALGWAPQLCLFAVDCDAPDHASKSPGSAWRQEMRAGVERLFAAYPGGYFYTTRGGMRIVYALPQGEDGLYPQVDSPAAARCWAASYRSWLAEVSRVSGIPVKPISGPGWGLDQACSDWTRLYRLPRVRRCADPEHTHCNGTCARGEQQVPDEVGDPTQLGTWPLPFVDVPAFDPADAHAEYVVEETDDALVAAARADLARLGPAVEFQGGNMKTRIAWGILINDYALPYETARAEMLLYNQQCQPPWDEEALFSTTGPARLDQNWNAPRGRAAARVSLAGMLAGRAAQSAPPPPAARGSDFVRAAVRSARAGLVRSHEAGELLAADRLGTALEGRVLATDAELNGVVAAVAAFVPGITEDEAVEFMLALGPEAAVRPVFAAVRAAVAPADDFVAEFTDENPPADDDELLTTLQKDGEGQLANTPANVFDIMRWGKKLRGHLRYDEISKDLSVTSPAIVAAAGHEVNALQNYLSRHWHLSVKESQISSTLGNISQTYGRYNPLVEHLESIRWDGTPRLGGTAEWGKVREEEGFGDGDRPSPGWLVDYLHASTVDLNGDDISWYVGQVGAKWLISAVARALCPGCKVDTVLVLEGAQGRKKSTAFRVIGGEWFFDDQLDLNSKDALQQISSAWIFELAELASLTRSATGTQKAFLSKQSDFFRAPYAKVPLKVARRAVFGATMNPESDGSVDYLKDTTGNRRWWPARVTSDADLGRLKDDRDQLLAEAVHRFRRGERWWFTRQEQVVADRAAAQRVEHDEWEGILKDWARAAVLGKAGLTGGTADRWTLPDIARAALGVEVRDLPNKQQRVGRALRAAGFREIRPNNRRMWTHPEFSVPSVRDRPSS